MALPQSPLQHQDPPVYIYHPNLNINLNIKTISQVQGRHMVKRYPSRQAHLAQ